MIWIEPIARFLLSALLVASAGYMAVQSLGRSLHGRLACGLLISVSAVMLTGNSQMLFVLGYLKWPYLTIASLSPFLFWLTAHGFFVDGFRLTWMHFLISLLMIGLGLAPTLLTPYGNIGPIAHYVNLVVSSGFILHGAMRVWLGHATDLDPGRYRFRARYAALPLVYLALSLFHESLLAFADPNVAGAVGFANSVYLACAAFYLTLLLHHYVNSRDGRKLKKQLTPHEAFQAQLRADDQQALARLTEQLQRRRVYTNDELDLASLAHLAHVPVVKARQLLVGAYGYRNFSKLLDGFRIKTAKSYLGDVDAAHMPVRDIAAIVGYRNEAALTQAFLRLEKETPAEFRQRAIKEGAAATRLQLTNTDR